MPIEAYSLCPGGTGEKIKFCCPDALGELQKIDRMIEGEQYQSCLSHIETLRKKNPDKACLLAIRGILLRATGQLEPAVANAREFLEKHPGNPVALAESAIVTAVAEGGRAAVDLLYRAIGASTEGIQSPIFEAMTAVAQMLLNDGEWVAGRALLQLQMAVAGDDPRPARALIELQRVPDIPLLMKDDPTMAVCPDDAPCAEAFREATGKVRMGDWRGAAEQLAVLAGEFPDQAFLWRNLATLRGWLADHQGQIEALRKYAALDVPLEDAVEAEAMAMLADEDPLGDMVDVIDVTWTVDDPEKLQTALALEPRVVQIPVDPATHQGDEPPPRAAYMLLDRPTPADDAEVNIQSISRILGRTLLYGRQTDCPARLEATGLLAPELPPLQELLREVGGEVIQPEPQKEVIGQVSASRQLFRVNWRPPPGSSGETIQQLAEEHVRDVILTRWPELPLGIFAGKSPRQAAEDPACRRRLLAAVLLMQSWTERYAPDFDFNQLRSELGLPVLEPIDPDQVPVERLPLVRLHRVIAERLPDKELFHTFHRATAFGMIETQRKLARVVVERPTIPAGVEKVHAYTLLAQSETDPEQALAYVEQGCQVAQQAGFSDAMLNLAELPLRVGRGEGARVQRLVEHLERDHINESGVAEALTHFLMQIGAIHPDGTPVAPQGVPGAAAAAAPPAAEPPGEQAGKLWTPDSDQGGGGKLWTPD